MLQSPSNPRLSPLARVIWRLAELGADLERQAAEKQTAQLIVQPGGPVVSGAADAADGSQTVEAGHE